MRPRRIQAYALIALAHIGSVVAATPNVELVFPPGTGDSLTCSVKGGAATIRSNADGEATVAFSCIERGRDVVAAAGYEGSSCDELLDASGQVTQELATQLLGQRPTDAELKRLQELLVPANISNQDPVLGNPPFTWTCSDLECEFEASDLSDREDAVEELAFQWARLVSGEPQLISEEMQPTFTFASFGSHLVKLTVKDREGGATSRTQTVTLTEKKREDNCYGERLVDGRPECVSLEEEKQGVVLDTVYVPNVDEPHTIVFSSYGDTETRLPGCAGMPEETRTCRYDGSLSGGVVYAQRLVFQPGSSIVKQMVSFIPDAQSDHSTFEKSVSWLPGDLTSFDPEDVRNMSELYDATRGTARINAFCSSTTGKDISLAQRHCGSFIDQYLKNDEITVFYANVRPLNDDGKCGSEKDCYLTLWGW